MKLSRKNQAKATRIINQAAQAIARATERSVRDVTNWYQPYAVRTAQQMRLDHVAMVGVYDPKRGCFTSGRSA